MACYPMEAFSIFRIENVLIAPGGRKRCFEKHGILGNQSWKEKKITLKEFWLIKSTKTIEYSVLSKIILFYIWSIIPI